MPAIISVDKSNNYKLVIKNCAPYYVTFERDDINGIVDIKEDEFMPLADDIISSVYQDIHNQFPKIQ
jgi:hypothetical protein